MNRKEKIQELKNFLQENYPNIQAFNTRNIVGDLVYNVYNENGIRVDYCEGWEYVEIFGLTEKEFQNLVGAMNHLKTFEIVKEK